MRNTIQALIELDRNARAKTAAADEEAQRIREETEAECERLAGETDAAIQAETERVCREIREKSDAEIGGIERAAEEKCARLDRIMAQSAEERKAEILNRILS